MAIDRELFLLAFGRDVDFHDSCPLTAWLDRHSGDVIWVFADDDDAEGEGVPAQSNREERERVAMEPSRYLEVPGLDHGQHHELLRQFLSSDWGADEALRRRAKEAYSGSIGRWKRDVQDKDIVFAFYAFREERIGNRAEAFLRKNGVLPKWR